MKQHNKTIQNQSVITLLVQTRSLPDKGTDLELLLLKLAEKSRQDEGCLRYEVYTDERNGEQFTLLENWSSDDLWQKHMKSNHVKDFALFSKHIIADWKIQNLRQLLY